MTLVKRLLDLMLAVLWLTEGRPLFYISERMQTPSQGFYLIKLRTMRTSAANAGVAGGDKGDRDSPIYAFFAQKPL